MKIGLDIETSPGLHGDIDARIVTIQLFSESMSKMYDCRNLEEKKEIEKILRNPEYEFVCFESLFDLYKIKREFGFLPKLGGDAFILALLSQEKELSLDDLSKKYLGEGKKGNLEILTNGTFDFNIELTQEAIDYGIQDAKLALLLENKMREKYSSLENIYKLELNLVPVLVNMRDTGLRLSRERYVKELRNLEDRLLLVKEWLYDKAGEEFKLQMRSFDKIFSKLGMNLPPLKTPGGKVSWSKEALELLPENEFITKLIEGRHIENVLGSQKDVNENLIGDKLHPEFRPLNFSGSARIYTSKPSVNSLPEELRRAIIPDEGKKFLYIDWTGAELMYLAYLAGQNDLIDHYLAGGDPHTYVSSRVLNKPVEDISKEEREISKVITFSIVFGSEGHAASRAMGISIEDAKRMVKRFFEVFPQVRLYCEKVKENAKEKGAVYTWMGRRRILHKIFSTNPSVVEEGLRQALNTPIQNGIADLLKIAMIRISQKMPDATLKFVVFDSFLLEVDENLDMECIKEKLEKIFTFKKNGLEMKLRYSIKEGYSWGDLMRSK